MADQFKTGRRVKITRGSKEGFSGSISCIARPKPGDLVWVTLDDGYGVKLVKERSLQFLDV